MRVDDFDFDLPEDRIALRPARPRDSSKLLQVGESLADLVFRDLPDILNEGDVLVLNNTKVLPASLRGIRPARRDGGGGEVEIDFNLHKPLADTGDGKIRWLAFARPAKRLKEGDPVRFSEELSAVIARRDGAEIELCFDCPAEKFLPALEAAGSMPLPPYIGRKRAVDEADAQDYQTMFAREEGSVAAPTAGLHFTPALFERLEEKGIGHVEVTLHVGAGTFLPVSAETTEAHRMHAEWGEISDSVATHLNEVRDRGDRIIAVGTTSLRLLESAAQTGRIDPFCAETDIFITPGYRFTAVDALITNFHLPRSTLFMLVCALAGTDRMKAAYAHAIEQGYRFYSYGDACFLERAKDRTDD
ncbi:tRNA preQ1(34) S-adenosylmethionine ribosyltransferase-isomerase QueA [Aquisalinus flavus]|uniref:S-adenosylmethionine:tRNA ribosyltransferase-isomerase n=1 Tax=Aquisalinus flavus TaxID=1526572 RepID=A0A8J2Y6F2_9PROT|nr:tRNA preQ1(34) S-adenosylmethionine ribosyltransferase-isomerase QueA [Aquisalinus flavus]MBD0427592.1 tRNA preQ1(34) S-adenosylmethionine ribosyltransferase-isomerase QueA [Aquisalinus flavus]UNE47382.1 tRNA preQ1(34) S-adenosylmethionine ribosyltransferase-isomerase QueA [Aquisalinus flavus]GGD02221.1 S-adenosylmethionine:tRNA ribosyltransferase-isomerase [Aquisalinus flavus]